MTEAVKSQDEDRAHRFSKSEEWCTVEQLLDAHGIPAIVYFLIRCLIIFILCNFPYHILYDKADKAI